MIRIQRFVTEPAVDFITILDEDFAKQCYEHSPHELFSTFSIPEQL